MSPVLPRVTAKDITGIIEKKGFVFVRQNGSHRIYKNIEGKRVTVPFHGSVILHPKILKSILKDTDITVESLVGLL